MGKFGWKWRYAYGPGRMDGSFRYSRCGCISYTDSHSKSCSNSNADTYAVAITYRTRINNSATDCKSYRNTCNDEQSYTNG
jgi:hypothetical protein